VNLRAATKVERRFSIVMPGVAPLEKVRTGPESKSLESAHETGFRYVPSGIGRL